MSDNNNNEAEALFATKRKKQQEEEARQQAVEAERKRLEELELQKQQMAEEIKRLENLQNAQALQESQEAQNAQASAPKGNQDKKKIIALIIVGVLGLLLIITIGILAVILSNSTQSGTTVPNNDASQSIQDENNEGTYSDSNGFIALLEQSIWEATEYKLPDTDFVSSFKYPLIFDKEIIDDEPEFTYFDEDSQQNIKFDFLITPNKDPFDIGYDITNIESLEMVMHLIYSDYPDVEIIKYDENSVYIVAAQIDDLKSGEENIISFMGLKEDLFIAASFTVTKEAEGSQRLIDISDILYLYGRLYDSVPLG